MMRRRHAVWMLFLCLLCVSAASTAQQERPLDNAEIVKLTKLDMGDAVIIAKIKSASEVKFETTTDDLVKLKDAGVSRAVIAAMLERQGAPRKAAENGAEPMVTLRSREGSTDLKAVYGTAKTQASPFSIVTWVQFDDLSAKTRIRDRRPTVLVTSDKDPRGRWWFVKASQQEDDEDYRYFDLGRRKARPPRSTHASGRRGSRAMARSRVSVAASTCPCFACATPRAMSSS